MDNHETNRSTSVSGPGILPVDLIQDATTADGTFGANKLQAAAIAEAIQQEEAGKVVAFGKSSAESVEDPIDCYFCKRACLDEIAEHCDVLKRGRSACAEKIDNDRIAFAHRTEGSPLDLAIKFRKSDNLGFVTRVNVQAFHHRIAV